MKKRQEYTHQEKLAYYEKRSKDKSLPKAKRDFAFSFLHGSFLKRNNFDSLADSLHKDSPKVEQQGIQQGIKSAKHDKP